MAQDLRALQSGNFPAALKEAVVEVALAHRILSPFTSFVAVEDRVVNEGGELRTVTVPVEMPQGVTYEGVFGDRHDASAPAELAYYEEFGLCKVGEGGALVDSGATRIGGRIPVNTSGGLLRKGHPVGATGLAQLTELVEQLRGQSGARRWRAPVSEWPTTGAVPSASTPPQCV